MTSPYPIEEKVSMGWAQVPQSVLDFFGEFEEVDIVGGWAILSLEFENYQIENGHPFHWDTMSDIEKNIYRLLQEAREKKFQALVLYL